MIEAVIFDMDGVIIDSETDYKQIELDMYAEMGLEMSEEDAVKSMGRVTVDWWRELKERFGFEQSAEELAEYENKEFTLNRNPKEFADISDYLSKQGRFSHLDENDIALIAEGRDETWEKIRRDWVK